MMIWTCNPEIYAERYAADHDKALEMLPVCSECGEPIQEDYCFEVNGEYICEICMNDNHRKWVDDIVC